MVPSNSSRNNREKLFIAVGGIVIGACAATTLILLLRDKNENNTEAPSFRVGTSYESSSFIDSNSLQDTSSGVSTVSKDDVFVPSSSFGLPSTNDALTSPLSGVSHNDQGNHLDTSETVVFHKGIFSSDDSIPATAPSMFMQPTLASDTTYLPTYAPTLDIRFPTDSPTNVENLPLPMVSPMFRNTEVGFRLKKYWETGYFWQESTLESWFCLSCDGGVCLPNMKLQIRHCKKKTELDALFSVASYGEAGDQIQIYNSTLCLQRMGISRAILLRQCKATLLSQRFLGFQPYDKFDLRPLNATDRCLTNHHHPKPNETIYAESCETAHKWKIGYWVTY